ncbi:MAG: hypothetical protein PHF12_06290 [Candidatus Omnitrophica bacterium]|jgi:flagellar basal body-associated protein FliL|nr:hypothetical protein [Candidatus Omnitrophota bacterium]MDD5538558.1 hypothetical protein [Candidatus Omnitrophota bacterium]
MKKSSLFVLVVAGCILAAVVLALAVVAFWMEKKTGYSPAAPPAAAPVSVPAQKATSAAVEAPAAAVDQEVSEPAQSPPQEEEQRDVEYDGVVRGPMTM